MYSLPYHSSRNKWPWTSLYEWLFYFKLWLIIFSLSATLHSLVLYLVFFSFKFRKLLQSHWSTDCSGISTSNWSSLRAIGFTRVRHLRQKLYQSTASARSCRIYRASAAVEGVLWVSWRIAHMAVLHVRTTSAGRQLVIILMVVVPWRSTPQNYIASLWPPWPPGSNWTSYCRQPPIWHYEGMWRQQVRKKVATA